MSRRLQASGERVEVGPPREVDLAPYRLAVELSAERLGQWNAVDGDDLARHLRAQSDTHRTFVVRAHDRAGSHGIVGKINVTNVVRGRFSSATLGYDGYDPYVGRGLFREGLALVVELALRVNADGGMGLHRVEANVQPGNVRSARVLRSLGFRHEGETPRMLYLLARGAGVGGGGVGARGAAVDGREAWRDHERYAMTREEWPAQPWAPHRRARRVILVNGPPGVDRTTLAIALVAELALPLLSADTVAGEALWALLTHCPTGAVVESRWPVTDAGMVSRMLRRAGVDPGSVVEVCLGPGASAPLGIGPVLHLGASGPLQPGDVVRAALQARALGT